MLTKLWFGSRWVWEDSIFLPHHCWKLFIKGWLSKVIKQKLSINMYQLWVIHQNPLDKNGLLRVVYRELSTEIHYYSSQDCQPLRNMLAEIIYLLKITFNNLIVANSKCSEDRQFRWSTYFQYWVSGGANNYHKESHYYEIQTLLWLILQMIL